MICCCLDNNSPSCSLLWAREKGEVSGRRDGAKVWESFNGKRSLPRNMMENQTNINFLELQFFKLFLNALPSPKPTNVVLGKKENAKNRKRKNCRKCQKPCNLMNVVLAKCVRLVEEMRLLLFYCSPSHQAAPSLLFCFLLLFIFWLYFFLLF